MWIWAFTGQGDSPAKALPKAEAAALLAESESARYERAARDTEAALFEAQLAVASDAAGEAPGTRSPG